MRHNLTNVAETQLDRVDSFYVVGSTTKEGLIEGRSNVKIDLKKAVAEGGGVKDITLGQAWLKAFNGFKTYRVEVPPTKVLMGWYAYTGDTLAPEIKFLENYDGNCLELSDDAIVYDIEDVPDYNLEEGHSEYFLLYKLSDLNKSVTEPIEAEGIYCKIYTSYGKVDFIVNQYKLDKFNTHIFIIDGEYYLAYNDNLD